MDTTWRTLSSKPVIKDRWIDIRADQCLTPAGVEISPYYVLTYPDWVHVVALTPERSLVLVKQYRHAAEASILELPGGGLESSDTDAELAARRELVEETGFTSERWLKISALYPNPATHTNRVHAFLALDAMPTHRQVLDQGEENLAVCLMPLDSVVEGLDSGLLGQSMHVAAVMLATRLLARL